MRTVAVDPGDVHVGLALWDDDEFLGTYHHVPDDAILWIKEMRPDVVVVEAFHLHPWRAAAQTWSTMPTSQLIGRIKQVAFDCGAFCVEQTSDLQRIADKTPYWKRHLRDHGKPRNPHEQSALKHGIYWRHMNPKGPELD